jgi:hypothetical protein
VPFTDAAGMEIEGDQGAREDHGQERIAHGIDCGGRAQ